MGKRKRQYWLMKSEPSEYSIDDLVKDKSTFWDGVRNYQARNLLRDEIQIGDQVLFYHSNADPMAIVGTATVIRNGYPDHTQFDSSDKHYDEKSDPENPRWFMVDIEFRRKFKEPVTRDMLREHRITADMMLLAKGSRLSVQPVTEEEWKAVHAIARVKP